MSLSDLTAGAIEQMVQNSADKIDGPILQVLSLKKVGATNTGAVERYRVILSDGKFYAQSMLAMQLKDLVDNGTIERHGLIRVTEYASNHVQSRRILILLQVEKFAPPTEDRLGNPLNVETTKEQSASASAAPAAAAAAPATNGAGGGSSTSASNGSALKAKVEPSRFTNNASSSSRNGSGAGGGASKFGGPGGTKSKLPIYPIEGLSPYQNKWTIRARVTQKGEIKHWSKDRSEGKLFSVNFLDESSEIRATGFNEEVDKFYNLLQENKVYYISKAKVTIAKKQFSNLPNDYELQFKGDTEIEECMEPTAVPTVQYNFVPLAELEAIEAGQTCDVLGVVTDVGEVGQITSKATQKAISKRELTLVDAGNTTVRLTLWGKTAENFKTDEEHPVMAFKNVKVGDFGGRSLSMHSGSSMSQNVDNEDAYALRGWYDAEGGKADFKSFASISGAGGGGGGKGGGAGGPGATTLEERRTVGQVKDAQLGMNDDRGDWFTTKATVVYIKADNLWYTACPSDGCNKKVVYESGGWRCEKCDRSYDNPQHRYVMTANVCDHTGQMWVSGFNDVGEAILGKSANELAELRENGEDKAVEAFVKQAVGKQYILNCRAKQETYGDNGPRVKYTITKLSESDWVRESNLLIESIKKFDI